MKKLSTKKLNDFPFIIVSCFISFMLVTAGSAIVPALALPGAYVACLSGNVSVDTLVQEPDVTTTVTSHTVYCTQGQITTNIVLQSIAISFLIYAVGLSLLWWAVRYIKLKTRRGR